LKIALLGANGQLGRSFLHEGGLASLGTLIPVSRDGKLVDGGHGETGDMASPDGIRALLDRTQPDVIVNAAAYTAVDRAEQDEDVATQVNGNAVGVIGEWAARNQALVVHYSTDYVFDGAARSPYPTDAATSPIGAYGRSKLAGELALRASGAHHLVFRTAWVYAAHGHNFLRTMLRLGAERDQLRVVADQHGAPTSTNLIVAGTVAALKRWLALPEAARGELEGTYHLVASGETTWHGFAGAIFEQAVEHGLLARKPDVQAIDTANFPTPAQRPAYSVLDNTGFQKQFAFRLPHWSDGLAEVIRELSPKRP
jgi:dTDP-4-dehydrorhamnose reductase